MILVMAGTRDGRELAETLSARGYSVTVSVVTEYGRQLAETDRVSAAAAAMDAEQLAAYLQERGVAALVDASHPYAAGASVNAMQAAARNGIPYIRFERKRTPLPDYPRLHVVPDAGAAARLAATRGKVLFLTTGSRTLSVFRQVPELNGHRLIARVLPEAAVINQCRELGFTPADIIAMQGPFSLELNQAMFRQVQADVIITKNSGETGGADSKFAAAVELGLELVVIERPGLAYRNIVQTPAEVLEKLKEAGI